MTLTRSLEEKMSNKKLKKKLPTGESPLGKMNSKDTASVLSQLIQAKKDYEMCKETEYTKRMDIEADLKKHMESVQLQRDVIFEVLEKEYSMRKDNIDRMYSILDKAYDDGRDEVVIQALESIEGIIKEGPAKALLTVREAFTDPNKKLII